MGDQNLCPTHLLIISIDLREGAFFIISFDIETIDNGASGDCHLRNQVIVSWIDNL